MNPIDISTLLFSLNNNNSCSISNHAIEKRIIFSEKGIFSGDNEILIFVTDKCFSYDADNEVYGHITKNVQDKWCSCLVFTHERLNKNLSQDEFLFQYYREIIFADNWSPMNSVSENDVFIESNSFAEAVDNMNKIIKLFSKSKHIPVSPDPEEEINGTAIEQEGNCDFRLLDLYGINLTCSQ